MRSCFFVFEILTALFHCRKERQKDSSKITDKALKTTVYEVFALVVCFAPLVISTPVSMFFSKIERQKESAITFQRSRTFAILNPFVYCWGQEEMRKFVFKTKTQVLQPVV